jgi:type IV secretory pathway VirB3-like protein
MRHLANIGLMILLILGLVVAANNPGMALVLLVILGIFRLARVRKSAVAGCRESSYQRRKKKRKGGFQDSYDYDQRCHIGTSDD